MKSFTAVFLSVVAFTSALPTTIIDARAEDQATATVCQGENFTGDCIDIPANYNQCVVLPEGYINNTGSFKVAPGAFCRITYTADTCSLHGDAFVYPTPGAPTLHHFDDPATGTQIDAGSTFTSFLCQQCSGCA
ncbi:hypothetical protein K504DRAFT_531334 [Pleomassaria siparia CBS 279.74]|uniref:Uncharacterized protein n=1 Tax=Pleomassaria siparia CBS 279.74 TaxID=1314801 RepID=A0A6G1KH92_9PLEO|nr:hypothetical protein K504DRAFT_531334 [Pleomassaria siparia CBS 279.74]